MKIKGTEDIQLYNTIVTIGKFDCFHKGHQLLFRKGAEMKQPGMEQVIFMFDMNPADVVNHRKGRYIVCQKERRPLSALYGIDHCIEYPFTDKTRNMSPEEFVRDILVAKLGVRAVVAGDDFRFGRNRSGDVNTLRELGEKYGFEVEIVERLTYKGRVICSTDIRDELIQGHLEDVNAMLGRPYALCGNVVYGQHIGTGNGVPTINLDIPEDKLLPPNGVYITGAEISRREYPAITNIGTRPTFNDDGSIVAETYILDYSGDLYGDPVSVLFYKFLRPEKRFENPDELYRQISEDIRSAEDYYSIRD